MLKKILELTVNSSMTKNIYSRLCATREKNVDTSFSTKHSSLFFMLQHEWTTDNELSLSEELKNE